MWTQKGDLNEWTDSWFLNWSRQWTRNVDSKEEYLYKCPIVDRSFSWDNLLTPSCIIAFLFHLCQRSFSFTKSSTFTPWAFNASIRFSLCLDRCFIISHIIQAQLRYTYRNRGKDKEQHFLFYTYHWSCMFFFLFVGLLHHLMTIFVSYSRVVRKY